MRRHILFYGRELVATHSTHMPYAGQTVLGFVEIHKVARFAGAPCMFECRFRGAIIARATRPGAAAKAGEKWLADLRHEIDMVADVPEGSE